MTFALSKILGLLLQPSTVLVVAIAFGLWRGRAAKGEGNGKPVRGGGGLAVAGLVGLVAAGLLPLGSLAMVPLEQRFPVLRVAAGDARFAGIIVLGGGEDGRISSVRGQMHINEAGERITEGARLARILRNARIVFTGGAAIPLLGDQPGVGDVAVFWEAMGIERSRIVLEGVSRNTYENALLTRDLLKPQPDQRWLLVTSATHMPRAMGVFRRAGFNVTAYPVDFRTTGHLDLTDISTSLVGGLKRLDEASKEWMGLVAYRLMGRTDALLPGP